jgi:hypothetical protein
VASIARVAPGRTFEELRDRTLLRYPRAEEALRRVLREEVQSGRVDYDAATGRYRLNGGLDPEIRAALQTLGSSG